MTHQADIDLLREQHLERIYALFEVKAKSFRWTLLGLIGLAFAFFGLIAFPYITLQDEGVRIEQRLELLEAELARATEERRLFASAAQRLQDTWYDHETQIDNPYVWESQLREEEPEQARRVSELARRLDDEPAAADWLEGDAERPGIDVGYFFHRNPDLMHLKSDPCIWLKAKRWRRCMVGAKLARVHASFLRDLRSNGWIGDDAPPALEPFGLQEEPEALFASFRAWLEGATPSWRGDASQLDLGREIETFVSAYRELVERFAEGLRESSHARNRAIPSIEAEVADQQARAAEVERQLERIRSLDRFETPLGPLPVGLGQLVLAFPVVLGVGFLAAATTLADAIRLRQVYHSLARQKDPTGVVLDDQQVTLIAPLWLEPEQALPSRVARLLVLTTPALVFMATLALAWQNRLFGVNFPSDAGLGRGAYGALYVLAAGLFVTGAVFVWRALRRYRVDSVRVCAPVAEATPVAA